MRRQDPRKDGDDGDMYVSSGLHYVNRLGYLISKVLAPEHAFIQVGIPMSRDDDELEEGES